jgi:tRNA threonylcarbamoyl adenosine modification protein (Sua5/YciO/YrdC/YwlC family)
MSQYFEIHPDNPQQRLIRSAVEIIRKGGVIVYPTDSCYALGCHIGDKAAMERIRRIRDVDEHHHFTLVCRDLSEVGKFARVDNLQYRLIKQHTPGSYTFILQATGDVPKRLLNPKRSTIGIRVPQNAVAHALLAELNEPLLSSTLIMPGDEEPLNDAHAMRVRLEHDVDLILDGGSCGTDMTTVIDLTHALPVLVRQGKGSITSFSFD